MRIALLAVLAVALVGSVAEARITAWNCDDDGDNAIVMNTPSWEEVGQDGEGIWNYNLTMTGQQNWGPAHVEGDFTSDNQTLDPIVNILETVENDTTFDWTGYDFSIGMTKAFQIIGLTMPDNWTANITLPYDAPGGQTLPNGLGTGWLATVVFSKGALGDAVEIDSSADFGVKVKFVGSTQFCTEQTPTPEPVTALLLGIGGLLLRRARR